MGMDRHSGSRRYRFNCHRYYRHLLQSLLNRVQQLQVEIHMRRTLRFIILNLSSMRSRRILLQLRTHLQHNNHQSGQPLRQLIRDLIQLKCDQDISNVVGRGKYSEFLSKRELRIIGVSYGGLLERPLTLIDLEDQERPDQIVLGPRTTVEPTPAAGSRSASVVEIERSVQEQSPELSQEYPFVQVTSPEYFLQAPPQFRQETLP